MTAPNRFRVLFKAELAINDVAWCRGCESRSSHRRGFATDDTVHYDSEVATRATLYRGLHEIAHVVLDHARQRRTLRRYEREAQAESWARYRMRELGVSVPRGEVAAGVAYVDRMKRWGTR